MISEYFTAVMYTVVLILPIIYGVYLKKQAKLNNDIIIKLLLVSGGILRLAYIFYTDMNTRQHDFGSFFRYYEDTHAGYILYLMEHHHIPDMNPMEHWQFYHPPLFHIISAVITSCVKAIGLDYRLFAPKVLQFVSVIYSMVFSVFAVKSLKLLGIKDKALALSSAVIIFHPSLIFMSGDVNNDMLATTFQMLAIYFTILWCRDRKWQQILGIALSIGLGMSTKLSVGLLAPAIAAAFLAVLIKQRKEWKKLIPQYLMFGVVCIPLGMWFYVKNYVKYGVPFTYVPTFIAKSGVCDLVSPLRRILDWSPYQFASPFVQWIELNDTYDEFNPTIALLKNAMFEEETLFEKCLTMQSFCTALFFAGTAVAFLSVAALVLMWSKKEKQPIEIKLLLTLMFVVVFGNYINFCIRYPKICTEHMRYCIPLIISGTAALGLMIQRFEGSEKKAERYTLKVTTVSMTAMTVLSTFIYTALMYYTIWDRFAFSID